MVSLVDIGPSVGVSKLRGKDVEINGLTASHIVGVMISFPEVRKILASKEFDLGVIVAQAPLAVAQMIAAGTGKAEDDATIQFANTLTAGEQYEIMKDIFGLTFPNGLKSLLAGLEAAGLNLGVPGWEAATKLPVPLSPASEQVETKETAGTAPPASSERG